MHTLMFVTNTEMVIGKNNDFQCFFLDLLMFSLFSLDLTRLSVWVLDGDPGHVNLLKYALNETNYTHTLVILTVSMTTPWSWKEQLEHWIKILSEHVHNMSIDPGAYNIF